MGVRGGRRVSIHSFNTLLFHMIKSPVFPQPPQGSNKDKESCSNGRQT